MSIKYFCVDYKNRRQYGYYKTLENEELERFCQEHPDFIIVADVVTYDEHEYEYYDSEEKKIFEYFKKKYRPE